MKKPKSWKSWTAAFNRLHKKHKKADRTLSIEEEPVPGTEFYRHVAKWDDKKVDLSALGEGEFVRLIAKFTHVTIPLIKRSGEIGQKTYSSKEYLKLSLPLSYGM